MACIMQLRLTIYSKCFETGRPICNYTSQPVRAITQQVLSKPAGT